MNRAEFRRQQKLNNKKDKIYNLTQAQLDKIKEEAVEKAIDVSFGLMLAIPTNVLARCYWEKSAPKRIPQFLDECLSVYESVGSISCLLQVPHRYQPSNLPCDHCQLPSESYASLPDGMHHRCYPVLDFGGR